MRYRNLDPERGFTLVELILAVTIMGIVLAAVSAGFIVMTRTMDQTQDRMTQSRGAKFAGVYWVPDVATSATVNPAGQRCGTTGTPLVTFVWVDDRQPAPQYSTWVTSTSGVDTDLLRMLCDATSLAMPKRTTKIAPDISIAGTAVGCSDGVSAPAPCGTDVAPAQVVLTVATADGRTFTVDGNREVS